MRYVQSPIAANEWLCWCGQLHERERDAAACRHEVPRLPGTPAEVPQLPAPSAAADQVDASLSRARWGLLVLLMWVLAAGVLLLVPGVDDPAPPAGRYAPADPSMNPGMMP